MPPTKKETTIKELHDFLYLLRSWGASESTDALENKILSKKLFPSFWQKLPVKRLLSAAEEDAAGERNEDAVMLLVYAPENHFSNRDLTAFFKIWNDPRLHLTGEDKLALARKIEKFVKSDINKVDENNVMIFLGLSHFMNEVQLLTGPMSQLETEEKEQIKF